jgi:hypothetical protein
MPPVALAVGLEAAAAVKPGRAVDRRGGGETAALPERSPLIVRLTVSVRAAVSRAEGAATVSAGFDDADDKVVPFTDALTGDAAAGDTVLADRLAPAVVAMGRRRRPVAVPDDVPLTFTVDAVRTLIPAEGPDARAADVEVVRLGAVVDADPVNRGFTPPTAAPAPAAVEGGLAVALAEDADVANFDVAGFGTESGARTVVVVTPGAPARPTNPAGRALAAPPAPTPPAAVFAPSDGRTVALAPGRAATFEAGAAYGAMGPMTPKRNAMSAGSSSSFETDRAEVARADRTRAALPDLDRAAADAARTGAPLVAPPLVDATAPEILSGGTAGAGEPPARAEALTTGEVPPAVAESFAVLGLVPRVVTGCCCWDNERADADPVRVTPTLVTARPELARPKDPPTAPDAEEAAPPAVSCGRTAPRALPGEAAAAADAAPPRCGVRCGTEAPPLDAPRAETAAPEDVERTTAPVDGPRRADP